MALVEENELVPCLFCDLSLVFPNGKAEYLGHLFLVHRMVIAEVEEIKYLGDYLKFWKPFFERNIIEEFCTTMLLNQKPDGTPSTDEKYYLLSDCVPQDCEIRQKIKNKYLAAVLERHQFEKNDENFEKGCLHCRDVIRPTRAAFLEHLYTKHFLQLGKPENLIFIDELVDVVEGKMKDLICLYCEKVFKDRGTLKEHMRKKGHKRINPENKFYDKFFLTNYYKSRSENKQQTSRPKEVPQRERRDSSRVFQTENEDSDWSDWESSESLQIKCLFCDHTTKNKIEELKQHMVTEHEFNFDEETEFLNFYKRIKLVNYIRFKICQKHCVACDMEFKESELLLDHMKNMKHFHVRNERLFNQPEFFFSTLEEDPFLCSIEDTSELPADDDSAIVIGENPTVKVNEDAENLVKEILKVDL